MKPRQLLSIEDCRAAVGREPLDSFAWWDALFSWANQTRETVLAGPDFNWDTFTDEAQKFLAIRARAVAQDWTIVLRGLRAGQVVAAAQGLPLALDRRRAMMSVWHLLNPQFAIGWDGAARFLTWRQAGKRKAFFSNQRLDHTARPEADVVVDLYERWPSCDMVQEWFTQFRELPKREGKSWPLSKIGRLRNAELRRVVVSVYGVKGSGKPLQQDDYGALYRVDDNTRAVHVTCPSTGREYWLGVPAACGTAREAVLWSFELAEPDAQDLTLLQEA